MHSHTQRHTCTYTCANTRLYTHTHIHIPETFPKWFSFLPFPSGKDRKLQVPDGMYLLRCFFIEVVFAISLRDKTHRRQ